MIRKWRGWIVVIALLCFSQITYAQESLYPIQVSEEGVYQIDASELERMDISPETVALFGYPGQLPQTLAEEDLRMHEIPIKEEDGNLYFFLSGPTRMEWDGENWNPIFHLGSDDLQYYLGVSQSPSRITEIVLPTVPAQNSTLYGFKTFREDRTNILNSGRVWYSDPIFSGNRLSIPFELSSSSENSWILSGALMAQSLQVSTLEIGIDSETLDSYVIDKIPDATYGIKGNTQDFKTYFKPNGNSIANIEIGYTASVPNSSGYVEYLTIGVPYSSLELPSGVFYSESQNSISVSTEQDLEIWDIQNFFKPVQLSFENQAEINSNKLVVFDKTSVEKLEIGNPITIQDRTGTGSELLIIAHKDFEFWANQLAQHKTELGLSVEVIDIDQVLQISSYGNRDVNGIRNFIAGRYQSGRLKNVLFFGKGTFDSKERLGGRPNLIPTYSSRESLNPLSTFSSDDFFALIEFGQGNWEESNEGDELMQIGVGRIPVINSSEAENVVNKIINYETNLSPGDWKRTLAFFVDDADNNIHVRDAEAHSSYLYSNHRSYFQDKLYLDRYPQFSTGSNQESPDARDALKETLDRGTLLLNYIGHGNETTLTAEEVFKIEDLRDWGEQERLALWVTATCEFGRHDSPFVRSAAEELLAAKNKGAIGLLTTGRPVFSSVNFKLNAAFIEEVFKKEGLRSQDLGSIFKNTKNNSLNGALNRNFSLIGDPSMRLADPELALEISSIKDLNTSEETDTLSAFNEIEIIAEVIDPLTGALQVNYNGEFTIDLRDKPTSSTTIGDESNPFEFMEEKAVLFRGSGPITAGELSAKVFISYNINYDFGEGGLRLFGKNHDESLEAFGGKAPVIGGSVDPPQDQEGPLIQALFEGKSGESLVFPSTQIILDLNLKDESGINVSPFSPGQELQIQVNDEAPLILNEQFLALNGDYREGVVLTSITGLKEGINTLIIRAWDNLGNFSSFNQTIEVIGSNHIQILDHLVYPNPASEETNFRITHNRPDQNLVIQLSVYNIMGGILFSDSQRLVGVGSIIEGIKWIFLQDQTKYPAKGTYIYKLTLSSETDNSQASVSGKIVIE